MDLPKGQGHYMIRHTYYATFMLLAGVVMLSGCEPSAPPTPEGSSEAEASAVIAMNTQQPTPSTTSSSKRLDTDLVSLKEAVPGIVIELTLYTDKNPFGEKFYRNNVSYLRYGTALKLAEVQKRLEEKGLRLKVWDSYRPFVVQEALYYAAGQNPNWVSDPYKDTGKKTHVRGVAVDCTIVDSASRELEMPTLYLDFKKGAERMKHSFNDLPDDVLANRALLKETMIACGMEPYSNEWWHYQDTDWERYPVIEPKDFREIHEVLLIEELFGRAMK